jgi:starvation-inducible DNA-binding protein
MKRPLEPSEVALLQRRKQAALTTPTHLGADARRDIAGAMNAVLADVFAIYLKVKNFHWHMSGSHFRDYHLMLDDQGDALYAMTDPLAERVRMLGGTTLRSIGHIARLQRVDDNDADYVEPRDMLAELREDNLALLARLREVHDLCDEYRDVATASLVEEWIEQGERRVWFLFEASHSAPAAMG